MAIIDDFKDIHSRMKGELKLQPKEATLLCPRCNGTGRTHVSTLHSIPIYETCPDCVGQPPEPSDSYGLGPAMPPPYSKVCTRCNGRGMDPIRSGPCIHCKGTGEEP
jgi:DnaJ-class molecular chaperone